MSPYAGHQLQPRDIAAEVAKHWSSLVKGTATFLAESHGYIGAWHDNLSSDGTVWSRDCGVAQISIPYSDTPTPAMLDAESKLRTASLDPAEYQPIVDNNILQARNLYDDPWTRDGKPDVRRWQPWAAYTSGWATFPEWWVWEFGIGPWVPTGHYIQNALIGVANYHLIIAKDMNLKQAEDRARSLQDQFNVQGVIGSKTSIKFPNGFVAWTATPPKPTTPPADGVGPRPVPNDGR